MKSRLVCCVWCGMALALSACESKPRTGEIKAPAPTTSLPTTSEATTPPPAFALLEQSPPNGAVQASDVYHQSESSRTFALVDDDGEFSGRIVIKRSATERLGAAYTDDEGTEQSELWRFDEQGNVVLVAHVDERENAITQFRPPLMVMPPELPASQPLASEASMRVVDIKNPLKVREQGKAKRTITYVGDQRLRTPRGEFIAQRLEITFTADLKLAVAEEESILFVVPGEGVVARQTKTTVKILGALSDTKRRTLVRID